MPIHYNAGNGSCWARIARSAVCQYKLAHKEERVMCSNCENEGIGRRDLLKFGAAGIVALGFGGVSWQAHAAEGAATALSADEALAAMKSGNGRYVSHPELCSNDLAQRRSAVAGHQAPWATVIGCADSRVPLELIFGGLGIGELFVARNAGNLVDTATLGTVEYGAAVLGSPLIVVLAHTSCGAVKAACDVVTENRDLSRRDRPDDRPNSTGCACGAEQPWRFRQQRRQGKRQADRRAADRGKLTPRRPRGRGEAEDRRSDLRPGNGRRHLSRLRRALWSRPTLPSGSRAELRPGHLGSRSFTFAWVVGSFLPFEVYTRENI